MTRIDSLELTLQNLLNNVDFDDDTMDESNWSNIPNLDSNDMNPSEIIDIIAKTDAISDQSANQI